MIRLLAMMFTAYDSRKNPAAGLLWRTVSHAFDSVANLTETSPGADALAATAEDYTKKLESMHGRHEFGRTYRALSDSGQLVSIRVDRYV